MLGRLQELERRFECVGEVRGLGLVFGIEVVKSKAGREPDPATLAAWTMVANTLMCLDAAVTKE